MILSWLKVEKQEEETAESGEAGQENILGRTSSFVPCPNVSFPALLVTHCFTP